MVHWKQMSRIDKLIIGSVVAGLIMCMLAVYGVMSIIVIVPKLQDKVESVQFRLEQVIEQKGNLEKLVSNLKRTQNFEDLFLILMTPKQMVDMKDLNEYIQSKKEFCWGSSGLEQGEGS